MNLEGRIVGLEGKHGDPSRRREDLFSHVSDDELRDIYKRVRLVVSREEAAKLDQLFGEGHEGSQG